MVYRRSAPGQVLVTQRHLVIGGERLESVLSVSHYWPMLFFLFLNRQQIGSATHNHCG